MDSPIVKKENLSGKYKAILILKIIIELQMDDGE
jgi:hypothetical protein